MKSLKSLIKQNGLAQEFSMESFAAKLATTQDLGGNIFGTAGALVDAVSTESFGQKDEVVSSTLSSVYQTLQNMVSQVCSMESFEDGNQRAAENQLLAGAMAAIAAESPRKYIKALKGLLKEIPSTEHFETVKSNFGGPAGTLQVFTQLDKAKDLVNSLENYNEKSQRDFRVVTVGYNLAASRQDEFAERIYPTTVINPIEGGVVQVLPYIAVLKDVHHAVNGSLWDTKEVNMVEAYRDPSILDDNATDLIPAVDPAGSNAQYFVDPAVIPPETIVNEQGLSIQTAPLKPGMDVNLMGISNANQLIQEGMLDVSDTIDPAGKLKAIYVKFQGKVIKFKVDLMPRATWQPDLLGDTRGAKFDFFTRDLPVTGTTKAIDGSTTAVITQIGTAKYTIRLGLALNGHISLSKGELISTAGAVRVVRIVNESRQDVDLTSGEGKTIVDALTDLEIVGFDLFARFTNTNRRQRGHLLQTRALQFRHPIPMHAPVTLPLSTMDEEGPGEVIKALTVNTNIRNSNNAVKTLLNYCAHLRELTSAGFERPQYGMYSGALASVMRPTYVHKTLDLTEVIDTLKSKDRWDDVCSAILNFVKGFLFPAYRNSNIEAAFRVISGNQDERPIFLFCSDKEIANYLMTKGDDRTLGAYLEYDIVSTNNELFDGKLVVVPTRKNPSENDILSFGQFFYVSTIVADLPISRGANQITREIAAIPFNLHINNIPFALEFDITGFDKVMGSSQWNKPVVDALNK